MQMDGRFSSALHLRYLRIVIGLGEVRFATAAEAPKSVE
jgi:hypothetical protein